MPFISGKIGKFFSHPQKSLLAPSCKHPQLGTSELESIAQSLTIEDNQHALKAECKQNFTLFARSNALRSKAKLMQKSINKQMCVVKTLSENLKFQLKILAFFLKIL